MTHVDPERRREYHRAWSAANRERVNAQHKAFRDENREALRSLGRERSRAYRDAHRDEINERARARRAESPEQARARGAAIAGTRRARERGAPVIEKIDRAAIIERDKQRCHLCGKRVAKREVTLDHIVPLAAGGEHTARNVAVAHASCNYRKGARSANDQLRLVG